MLLLILNAVKELKKRVQEMIDKVDGMIEKVTELMPSLIAANTSDLEIKNEFTAVGIELEICTPNTTQKGAYDI